MEHGNPKQRASVDEHRTEAQRVKPSIELDELKRRLDRARRARLLGGPGFGPPAGTFGPRMD